MGSGVASGPSLGPPGAGAPTCPPSFSVTGPPEEDFRGPGWGCQTARDECFFNPSPADLDGYSYFRQGRNSRAWPPVPSGPAPSCPPPGPGSGPAGRGGRPEGGGQGGEGGEGGAEGGREERGWREWKAGWGGDAGAGGVGIGRAAGRRRRGARGAAPALAASSLSRQERGRYTDE